MPRYREPLITATTYALRLLFVQEFKVPLFKFGLTHMTAVAHVSTFSKCTLGQKYWGLAHRKKLSYMCLNVKDEYFGQMTMPKVSG
jgi:hypothetical protein